MTLFEYVLRENKDHLLRKLNFPDPQKDAIIVFFHKHPEAEKRIDWQKLSQYSLKFFNDLFTEYENKGQQRRQKIKQDLSVAFTTLPEKYSQSEFIILYNDKDVIVVEPLNWECAVYMNSSNLYGSSAKWCIGYEQSDSHWVEHTEDWGEHFAFAFYNANIDPNFKKWMFQFSGRNAQAWAADDSKYPLDQDVIPEKVKETIYTLIEQGKIQQPPEYKSVQDFSNVLFQIWVKKIDAERVLEILADRPKRQLEFCEQLIEKMQHPEHGNHWDYDTKLYNLIDEILQGIPDDISNSVRQFMDFKRKLWASYEDEDD